MQNKKKLNNKSTSINFSRYSILLFFLLSQLLIWSFNGWLLSTVGLGGFHLYATSILILKG